MRKLRLEQFPQYLIADIEEIKKAYEDNLTQAQGLDCIEDSLASSIKSALIGGEISEEDARAILERWPVL